MKTFGKFTWQLDKNDDPAGWHVILGMNGTGKSTFIKAAAISLMGPEEALKSRTKFRSWIRSGEQHSTIQTHIIPDTKADSYSQEHSATPNTPFTCGIEINTKGQLKPIKDSDEIAATTLWDNNQGWFSASFGPFRRFTGGSDTYQAIFDSAPLLARHISVFGEDIALTEALSWLKELKFKQLEGSSTNSTSDDSDLLEKLILFINQEDFLPGGVKMQKISSDGILFNDSFGATVTIEDLSDGFRSILSMMLELIRQMVSCYQTSDIFDQSASKILLPGVVFIDEIDVHLHPHWQRRIGNWLTKHFPNIQFIVTTHSLLICQSAIKGSIWRLPNETSQSEGERITGLALDRLLYGNILEATQSGAFDIEFNRSTDAQALMNEFANLNIMAARGSLNNEQKQRQQYLNKIFIHTDNAK